MTTLRVSEVFGPTIQGEGPHAGRTAVFVRLWGCNLDCAWCDTPYTWDTTGKLGIVYERDIESDIRTIGEVVAEVETLADADVLVVITGGEPMVQGGATVALVAALGDAGYRVEIETNGTRPVPEEWTAGSPEWLSFNVSPKLGHADTREINLQRMAEWALLPGAVLKFVVTGLNDLREVASVIDGLDVIPWIMPEGRTSEQIVTTARTVVDEVTALGWNLSLRNHVILWGDERKR